MRAKSVDLIVVVGVALLAAVLTSLSVGGVALRALCTVPLVLVLPGYALTAATFRRILGVPERLVCAFGLSIAVAALGGFVLNWTTWGLRAGSWAILLSGITLVASVVAFLRGRTDADRVSTPFVTGLHLRDGVLFGMATLIAVGAIVVASVGASQSRSAAFTQLWLLPDIAAVSPTVRLGVKDGEGKAMTYRVQLTVAGAIVQEWPTIELRDGAQWEVTQVLSARQLGGEQVEALLYRLDKPSEVYRRATLPASAAVASAVASTNGSGLQPTISPAIPTPTILSATSTPTATATTVRAISSVATTSPVFTPTASVVAATAVVANATASPAVDAVAVIAAMMASAGAGSLISAPTAAIPVTIIAISPTTGPASGGTRVTVTGMNLADTTSVTFRDISAASFTIDSPTQITVITPAGLPGAVLVVVKTPRGMAVSPTNFIFV